ncbi:MAG: hypothetical protein AB7T49_09555 [Oligoflexales bacterium]
MRIEDIRVWKYELRCKAPIHRRVGLFVEFCWEDGAPSFGEVAPFAAVHEEGLDEAFSDLRRAIPVFSGKDIVLDEPQWSKRFFDFMEQPERQSFVPSVTFGVEHALVNKWMQTTSKRTTAKWETAGLIYLAHADVAEYSQQVAVLRDEEAKVAKFKIGGGHIRMELDRLKSVLREFPSLGVRLDANGRLREDDIRLIEESVDSERVEFVEDPGVRMPSKFKYAAESVLWGKQTEEALASADFFVVKPSRLGGYSDLKKIIDRVGPDRVVLSSAFDSQLTLETSRFLSDFWGVSTVPGFGTAHYFLEHLNGRPDLSENCVRVL